MQIIETELPGVLIVQPKAFGDSRGWFMESYSKIKTPEIDCDFVQDNHSFSAQKGVLRGIHFQRPPMQQAKLVRCTCGAVLDVAVDLRISSPHYRRWVAVELSADNKRQLFIPRGFGHGFLTLTENVEFLYKTDNYYSSEHDGAIFWADPSIGVDWGIENPVLSEKDKNAPLLGESRIFD